MEPLQYEQRGYLNEDFHLFHLADNQRQEEIAYHYHTFHKVILLLAGRADYAIEGGHYHLRPGDFVLVGRGSIHRPEVAEGDFYDRVILYIAPEYLQKLGTEDLGWCFSHAQQRFHYVYHSSGNDLIRKLLHELECATEEGGFGSDILRRAIFAQLMVALNRAVAEGQSVDAASGDTKIVAVLQYLNTHLTENLSIDELAARFYISKYHLMRRFRSETGYTIHNYITEKRLLLAQQLLEKHTPLWEVAENCGYQDYSTFSRAYKKQFGYAPSEELREKSENFG